VTITFPKCGYVELKRWGLERFPSPTSHEAGRRQPVGPDGRRELLCN